MQGNTHVEQPSPSIGQHRDRDLAPRVATGITAVVLCGFFGIAATYLMAAHLSPAVLVSAILLLLATLSLQLLHSFGRQMILSIRPPRATLAVQGLLTYAPFLVLGRAWLGMPGFLAASTLLLLPASFAWPAFVMEVLATDVIVSRFGIGPSDIAYTTVATILTALVVYGLSRLTELVAEVHDSRAELARLAIAQERLRFARDLHDLLGYSLSAITLKCELAYRLVPGRPDRAQEELTEILQTARQALTDVRTVARGYRDMSLSVEASTAESMLSMLGVHTTVALDCGELPPAADTVLATVLREGLTNMLRHSKAENVEIIGGRGGRVVHVTIANDGVGRTGRIPSTDATGSSGIANLTARVREHGGHLSADIREDGWFVLRADILLPPAGAAAPRVQEAKA
ncbi:sensor histidine kinase [Streptomyces sp. NRRL S-515]|uniref:sensor histidine kinase n=2 Tax=unclassified Streptomyces TaxID=2593676 RepID=UPI0004BE212C|nr:histidine kinase [Streptomyces sp. NRRL S-515]